MQIPFINQVTTGDFLQFLVELLTGSVSLVVSFLALYYSFFKGAKMDIYQKEVLADVQRRDNGFGSYDDIKINTPFYLENIGGAKATVLTIDMVSNTKFKTHHYEIVEFVINKDAVDYLTLPFIFGDGEVSRFNAQIHLTTGRPHILKEKARNAGIAAQHDLTNFPEDLKCLISCHYRDGRGKEKTHKEKIRIQVNGELRAVAKEIERNQRKIFGK